MRVNKRLRLIGLAALIATLVLAACSSDPDVRDVGTRAVIIGADFNAAFIRVGDRNNLMRFRRRLELRDSGAGPELSYWRERDYILYRSGSATVLHVEQAGEGLEFVERDRALSDHPAIYARFRVTLRTSADGEQR